ncbi:MAG TPA: glycosyl hydrolase [Longimicrobiaceae bacterium]
MTAALAAVVLLGGAPPIHAQQPVPDAPPAWPEITRESRPWTRWWWHGSAVDETNLTDELEELRAAGIGGVEITPIYGVYGAEDRFIDYLSPRWMEVFTHTLREAERLDLGVDMATGNGWPFGGPWVGPEEASRYLAHRTYTLNGGERLQERIVLRQEPLLRAVGNQIYETYGEILAVPGQELEGTREQPLRRPGAREIDIAQLRDPVAQNEDLQSLALEQVRFPRELPLQRVIARSEDGQVLDLTERVGADGTLDWTAPQGRWTVYALFLGWHGKMVERAGPGGEGEVIDHFSDAALEHYLQRFDEAFSGYDLSTLRGFFNDSYEVDDASGEANWTPELFEEFRERRGYDLGEYLPALLFGAEGDTAARVLTDYRQTVAELLLEKFTEEWREWANEHGAITRNQAHGSPANILDLYAASDIPETEGTEIQRIKFASSAAHVTGKRLTAAEAATWLGEHFTSTLADVRRALDRFLLGGVNHLVYHGTAYSPQDAPWPGWLFYAAVHFNPQNTWWGDFGALNRYVARIQSFLQQGEPDEDLLLYFPISDWYARRQGDALLQHFNGIPGDPESRSHPFVQGATQLHERGYGYDFVSDAQLQEIEVEDGELRAEGGQYRALIVPRSTYIPLQTAERIFELARNGSTILAYRGLAEEVAGLAELETHSARLRELLGELRLRPVGDTGLQEAAIGEGRIVIGSDLDAMLGYVGVRRESMTDSGLEFIRRRHDDGTTYFVVNWGETPVDGWVPFASTARAVALYDPMTGESGYGHVRLASGGVEVHLQLQPGESAIIRLYDEERSGRPWHYLRPAGPPDTLEGTWTLRFVIGGPTPPQERRLTSLGSWTELEGEDVDAFSGSATYTLEFERPAGSASAYLLDLGEVHESAGVALNGDSLATLIGPSFRVKIPAERLRERNRLEVTVTNLMANRIADLDRRGVFWKRFYNVNFPARLRENRGANGLFDASRWEPFPSGLVGPVTLQPLQP